MLDKVLVLKSNPHYRIGDIVFRQGYRWLEDREEILKNKKYKKSFLYDYLSNLDEPLHDPYFDIENTIPRNIDDKELLFSIIKNNKPKSISENTLYIHIRAGDIVQQDYGELMSMWLMNQNALIHRVADILTKSNEISKICIITAFHFGDFKSKSYWVYDLQSELLNKELLSNLINKLQRLKPTSILSSKECKFDSIDKHFFYLCHAKNVLLDNSGMSKVVQLFRNNSYG